MPYRKSVLPAAASLVACLALILAVCGWGRSIWAIASDTAYASASPAGDTWEVPPSADAVKNPVPADTDSIARGKQIYEKNCLACHGDTGKGDGPAAVALQTRPGDLSDPEMWKRSDGNLFYKVTVGRGSMKGFTTKLSDTQRWDVVNYIRTFAPKPAKQ